MPKQGYIAFDLGAESGRAMLATLDDGKIALEELHRFRHLGQPMPDGLHWDLTGLWSHLRQGLRACGAGAGQRGVELVSIGVDTWGVDFGLVGESGQLLGLPFCYRDARHQEAMPKVLETVSRKEVYDATGIQFMYLNTLYQLYALAHEEPAVLGSAKRMLMMPDLFHYFFTGEQTNEWSNATTTQMLNTKSRKWAAQLLRKLDIPTTFLGELIDPGTVVGTLRDAVAQEAGIQKVQVTAPATHDTAAAVAAVPVDPNFDGNWAYLSSGTWSLMGAEIDEPIITDASCEASFTNEGGVGGTIRFLKNIAGLWLVQECRRDFEKQGHDFEYEQLVHLAEQAERFRTLVDPDHGPFVQPGEMPAKIAAFADATNQPKPETEGQFVRCCLESLAMAYRRTLGILEQLTGKRFDVLHIVGGGGQNKLLNQMTADAIGRPVVVGPYEATAIGNALTQALGTGAVGNLTDIRTVVRNSYDLETVEPKNPTAFDDQYERWEALLGN